MNKFDEKRIEKEKKIKLIIKQHINDNTKIPFEEHKKLGFSLELMRLRLFNKQRYRTKTSTKSIRKLTKKIEELKGLLEYELCQEYRDLSKTNGFYYGRDGEVHKIIDKKQKLNKGVKE